MPRTAPPPVLEFHRRETVRDGLRRVGAVLSDAARRQTERPAAEHAEAVHEMRRLLKRLRAFVRLVRPVIGTPAARKHNDQLRRAAQRLAAARDATVGLRTLDGLAAAAPRDAVDGVREVRDRFAAKVHDRAVKPVAISRGLAGARAAITTAIAGLDRHPWKRSGWDALEAGLRAGYRRARRRGKEARPTRDEEIFHSWRTATKSLMYQMALLRPARPARMGPLLRSLDELQDRLGWEHDLAVLAARLKVRPASFGDPAAVERTLGLIASRQQALRKECLRRGRKLFTASPAEFVAALRADWKQWRRA